MTVLTTSAYGTSADDAERGIVRAADAQLWRARLHGAERVDSLYDSDTYSGKPHPLRAASLSRSRSSPRGRRSPAGRRSAFISRALRLRDHQLAAGVGAPDRPLAQEARRTPWVADVRDAWTFEPLRPRFPTAAPAPPRRAPGAPLARRRRRRRLRLRTGGSRSARAGDRPAGGDPQRLGPRDRTRRTALGPGSISTLGACRSSTRAASEAMGAIRGRSSRDSLAWLRRSPAWRSGSSW